MAEANQNPEQLARDTIDAQLRSSGWAIQNKGDWNHHEGPSQAVREFQTDTGPADYVLFVNRQPVGIIEAKREDLGQNITTVEEQSTRYATAKLKRKPLRLEDLRGFIDSYSAKKRSESERWKKFTFNELIARDKTSLDLFWLKNDSLADLDNLPEPEIIAEEIIENIEAGLASFRAVAASLETKV
ncbi:type I restriction endonuclease [Akkermansiaceae bacterium]|nr:type I restriction endonuclease [Akkermansiaceae bacterium]